MAEFDALMATMYSIIESDPPMTCRQVFYPLVALGAVEKSEREYKNVAIRLLGKMRRQRIMPFAWIADETRWIRRPVTYASLDAVARLQLEFDAV